MIEAGANEVPEAKMIEAIYLAHDVNQTLIAFIEKIVAEVGKPKHSYVSCAVPEELTEEIRRLVPQEEMEAAVFTDDKQTREENIRVITERLEEAFAENEEWLAMLGEAVYQYEKKTVRKMILKDQKRPDGRPDDPDPSAGGGSGPDPQSPWLRHVYPWTDPDLQRLHPGSLIGAAAPGRPG